MASATGVATTELDPYTVKASARNKELTAREKIQGLHDIVKNVKTGMFTTRSADGCMHSRAMAPAGPCTPNQTTLVFLANNATGKFDELHNDQHVNVSFYDDTTTDWASYCGTARTSRDKEVIREHWGPTCGAWFGDLGDGIHKGDVNDPRISVIEVIPDSIHYWKSTSNAASRAVDVAACAIAGTTSAPGELRVISKEEMQLLYAMDSMLS